MSTETSSVYNKFKKLKLSLKKRSKNLKNEVESRDTTRKRGSASVGNRTSRSVVNGAFDGVPGKKRKRVYADQGTGEERTRLRDRDNSKDSFKKENNRFRGNENDSFRKGSNRSREKENDSFKKGSNRFRENENDSIKKESNRFRENENDSIKKESNRFRENDNDSYKKGSNRFRENENDSFKKGSNRFRENERSKGKDSLKGESNVDKNVSIEDKFSKSHRTMWVPNKKENGALESKQPYTKGRGTLGNAKASFGKLKADGKLVDRREYVEVGSGHNLSRKKFAESKSDSTKRFNQGRSKSSDVSLVKSWKKTAHHKKILDDDSSLTDDQPRKRKRIRLDPHDTSNKRLEDSVVINERRIKEKKEDLEQDDKLSMNAQFRAIQPSPSILSFVEDNLLGRRRLIELRRAGYNIELPAPLDNIPSTSSERERIGENLFRNKLSFFAAAKVSSSFPPPEIPEIAFAGRSNVGKSSLLNSLTRQWGVVRTSDKPGLTQTINFFNLGPKVCLVDLPGYGFAYAKEEVKDAWEELVKEYVSTRIGLRQVCLLIDTKWGMKPRDHELIDLMERFQTKYQIVLTKTDTVFPIDVARRAMQIEESLKANKSIVQPVMMVSSKSGAGIQSLRTVLTKIARFAKL